jgi:hypothetical protein
MAGTIIGETKREGQRKDTQPVGTKKGRKLVLLMVRTYLTHNPLNVTCMQIMRFNYNGRSRTSIIYQLNLPLYSKG